MLKSFQIDNFRLFQHLEVKKLSRVNLIVGKNNSGKSSFLEALRIYASNATLSVIFDIIKYRKEDWISISKSHLQVFTGNSITFAGNSVRHLFFDHKLPQLGEEGISIGEISPTAILNISIAAYQDRNEEGGITKKVRLINIEDDLSNIEIFLIIEEGSITRRLFRLDKNISDDLRHNISQHFEVKYLCQIVATENISNRQLASLWDITSLTELESEVINALRLIDHRVRGIAFVECFGEDRLNDPSPRIPLVKLDGIDEPLPLKSMGDGMTRLFHIIVALVNAKNGLLLIDEFENGLHWSVQPKAWDIIFQLSEKLNVQVFATTHSRDCIAGFDDAWNNYPELGAFFRLDRKNDMIKATEYTLETLTDSLEVDVEVR